MPLITEDEIQPILNRAIGRAIGHHVERTHHRVAAVGRVGGGRRDAIDLQRLGSVVQVTKGEVTDGFGRARDGGANGTIGRLQDRGIDDDFFTHDHILEGGAGARAFLTADDDDVGVGTTQVAPVGDFASEDGFYIIQADLIHRNVGMHSHGDTIKGDGKGLQLGELFQLRVLDDTRRHAYINRILTGRFDADTGAAPLYVNGDVIVHLHIGFSEELGQGLHGGGTSHTDAYRLRFFRRGFCLFRSSSRRIFGLRGTAAGS